MKALTILEPWASLIVCGAKTIETRSWKTNHHGKIAIHAGQSCKYLNMVMDEPFCSALKDNRVVMRDLIKLMFNGGCVVAIADLIDCIEITSGKIGYNADDHIAILANGTEVRGDEYIFGNYQPGRYAWILDNVERIEPVWAKGQQRLWDWEMF